MTIREYIDLLFAIMMTLGAVIMFGGLVLGFIHAIKEAKSERD